MDGEMGLADYLKVICVSGFYQLCFLKLDAAALESKGGTFLLFSQCAVSTHLDNNYSFSSWGYSLVLCAVQQRSHSYFPVFWRRGKEAAEMA